MVAEVSSQSSLVADLSLQPPHQKRDRPFSQYQHETRHNPRERQVAQFLHPPPPIPQNAIRP